VLFPKKKMRILSSLEGKSSKHGWLELNIATEDLDGVSKIVVSLDDVEALREGREKASEALERTRKLLGGD